jgi:Protein of unknown function (DUF3667)
MAHEIEAAQADAAAGLFRFRRKAAHTAPPGTPCANCGAELLGPWCHACGQLGEDFHRSWFHLVGESVEGLLHFDGRFWRTLPDLVWRPACLTRAYLEGHRAPQIPPLRLFLVVLLLVFVVGSFARGRVRLFDADRVHEMQAPLSKAKVRVVVIGGRGAPPSEAEQARMKAMISKVNIRFGRHPDPAASAWIREHLARVLDNPEAFQLIMESWSERFAFLMLPVAALLLSLLFVFERQFYLFDHLIFSMHSLSFVGLLISVAALLSMLPGSWGRLLLLAAPVHLFVHMRGVYGSSVFGTLARMALLFVGSLIGFVLLMLGLVVVGLTSL